MAVQLPSAAPPTALKVWTDGLRIFADIGGYVMAFPLTEGGLTKVLGLLRERKLDYSGQPQYRPTPKASIGTELQQAHADSVLRKLRIL